MKVVVGPLAQSGLETRVGPNLPAAINTALVYYVGKLSSGRGPARYPKFLTKEMTSGQGGNPEAEVEVKVDEKIEAALEREARAQGTTLEDLASHAVLVYLAELDLIGEPVPAPQRRVHA